MKRLFLAATAVVLMMSCANAGNRNVAQDTEKSEQKVLVTKISEADYKIKVEDFTTKEWDFKGNLPAVVDFYADWCGPCRRLAPIMDEVAAEFQGKVNFYKVNVDNAQEVARAYGVRSIPMVLFIPAKGEPVSNLGLMSKEEFIDLVNKNCLKK